MRKFSDGLLFSATDLMRFTGCAHATSLDLMRMHGNGPEPREDSEDAALLQAQGDAHEAAYLAQLKAQGLSVVEIPDECVSSPAERSAVKLIISFAWVALGGDASLARTVLEGVASPPTILTPMATAICPFQCMVRALTSR